MVKPGPLKRGPAARGRKPRRRESAGAEDGGAYWIFGAHAVREALGNPRRQIKELRASRNAGHALAEAGIPSERLALLEEVEPKSLARLLPEGAVHQGFAAFVEPLPPLGLADLAPAPAGGPLLVLDQVTDPRNVGAILRSAAAFGAGGLLVQDRHSPPESGVLAKAASGALEHVPLVRVPNLAQGLRALEDMGYWRVGLAGEADADLEAALAAAPGPALALVLGAEGTGLRRLTRETCDALARLPTQGPVASLNVSAAAAVALYAATGHRPQVR